MSRAQPLALEAELEAAERSRFTPTQWSRLKSSIVNGYNSLAALQRKIAIEKEDDKFEFRKFTPLEFMKYSTIPPFKVYFNLPLNGEKKTTKRSSKKPAIALSEDNFNKMNDLFKEMKEEATTLK